VKNRLILPCEIAVKSVIPAIKATLTKGLVETHHLKQNQVAEILGISQSAVSKYTRHVRGHVIKIDKVEEIQPLINRMMSLLVNGNPKRADFLRLFCQTCTEIRKKGLMCQFCQKTDPQIKMEECRFCVNYNQLQNEKGNKEKI
jgi:predicted transcriptional regulator